LSVVFSPKDEDISLADGGLLGEYGDEVHYSWLLHQLPSIPHFEAVRPGVIVALRSALLVETQPRVVAAYLRFLASHALNEQP
jgi:integrator complex subunit 1